RRKVVILIPVRDCACVHCGTVLVSTAGLCLCPLRDCACVHCGTVLVSTAGLCLCPLRDCACVHCGTVLECTGGLCMVWTSTVSQWTQAQSRSGHKHSPAVDSSTVPQWT